MKIINLTQGEPAWHAHRAAHFNASDAPAMMGASSYTTRAALLRVCAGGDTEEISAHKKALFDRGHATEAAIRPHIEALIGDDLYPVIGVSDVHPKLSASFDGLTMSGEIVFEHKQYAAELFAAVQRGQIGPEHYWQLEQQLLVSGAKKVLFAVSDGTPERCAHLEYLPVPGRRQALIAGWQQFEADLAEFKPTQAAVESVGRAPESLLALRIEVSGMVKANNLAEFKERAIAVFQSIRTDLKTDQDFADAAKTCDWCSEIEARLKAAKEAALGQTQDIDALFRAMDAVGAEARAKRLELEKLVQKRKDAVRFEIMDKAKAALQQHVATINASMKGLTIQVPPAFQSSLAAAIKGKKTITSVQDACDGVLAAAKIECNHVADQARINIQILSEAKYQTLFPDRDLLALSKSPDDLRNLIAARIAQHEEAERQRAQAQAARNDMTNTPVPQQQPVEPSSPAIITDSRASARIPPKPADAQIVSAVARTFGVPLLVAGQWIRAMDHNALREAA